MKKAAPRYLLLCLGVLLFGCAGKPEILVPPPEPLVKPPPSAEELQESEPVPKMQYETRFIKNGVTYRVTSFGLPGDYELTVFVTRGEFIIHDINIPVDWDVTDIIITDLNRNGFPELFVIGERDADTYPGAGSGAGYPLKEGRLIGWEYGALELRELRLPRFTERQASAYRGGDIFTFESDRIVRQYGTMEGPVTVKYVLSLRGRLEVL